MRVSRDEARKLGVEQPATKRRKFGNVPTIVDGHTFHSKREAARYGELKLAEKAGEISGLELQPRFTFTVNGEYIGSYTADFLYYENGKGVVEDVKGVKTQQYRLRKKLMKAIHGIDVKETA